MTFAASFWEEIKNSLPRNPVRLPLDWLCYTIVSQARGISFLTSGTIQNQRWYTIMKLKKKGFTGLAIAVTFTVAVLGLAGCSGTVENQDLLAEPNYSQTAETEQNAPSPQTTQNEQTPNPGLEPSEDSMAREPESMGRIGGRITLDDGGPMGSGMSMGQIMGGASNPNRLTFDMLEAILEIPGVIDYNITSASLSMGTGVNFDFPADDMFRGFPIFSINTASNSELMEGFANGTLRLESGRHLRADDHQAVIISSALADYNNMGIDDILEIDMSQLTGIPGTIIELRVVGIFSGTLRNEASGWQMMATESNLIADSEVLLSIAPMLDSNIIQGLLTVFVDEAFDIEKVFDEIANLPEVHGRNISLNMERGGFN